MGREESAAQAKEAAKAQEAANAAKKTAQRDKQWAVGVKDTSSEAEAAAKAAEAAARAAARKAQEAAEGGLPVVKPKPGGGIVMSKCKLCKKPFDPRKGGPC
jgi:hypothetical protein